MNITFIKGKYIECARKKQNPLARNIIMNVRSMDNIKDLNKNLWIITEKDKDIKL